MSVKHFFRRTLTTLINFIMKNWSNSYEDNQVLHSHPCKHTWRYCSPGHTLHFVHRKEHCRLKLKWIVTIGIIILRDLFTFITRSLNIAVYVLCFITASVNEGKWNSMYLLKNWNAYTNILWHYNMAASSGPK
jgi:hypothetical protein